jgi:MFS family permease
MLLAFTYTAVSPVYFYEPIALGGLGFTPVGIAVATAVAGLSQAIWLLVVFPRLHKRIGTGRVLFCCACAWPISFASCAVFNMLRRHGLDTVFWAMAPPSLVVWSGVAMAFTAVQLTVNDIAPSHTTLGTLNSIVLAIQSGIRAIAPALATSIYAVGVKYQILSGHLFWLLIVILALGLSGVLRLLPAKVAGKPKQARNGPA